MVLAVSDRPAEFFLIHQGIDNSKYLNEYFVIANLPQKISEEKIIKLVEDYNRKTITADNIKSYSVWRHFYRETEDLTRNYQEGAPYPRKGAEYLYYGDFPGQQISYHFDNLLIDTLYSRSINGISTSVWYLLPGAEDIIIITITDIDSYFAGSDDGDMP